MTVYGFYSSDKELPDDYTDNYSLYMIGYHKGFTSIYENTSDHSFRISEKKGNKWIRLLGTDIKEVNKSTRESCIEDECHYRLLLKLSDYLKDGDEIVFRDMQGIGKTPYYAKKGYAGLIAKGIILKFVSCSSLDSRHFVNTGKAVESSYEPLFSILIRDALEQAEKLDDLPKVLNQLSGKEKKLSASAISALKNEIW